jgi:DNA-directed RNA polymerase subunit F
MEFKAEDFKDDSNFSEYIKTVTESAVEDQTSELKLKIEELIGEKRTVTEKMKEFEGLDVEKAKEALEMIQKNDMVRRIADGKFDEVLAEKTDQLRTQYDEAISAVNEKLAAAENSAKTLSVELENTRIDAALRKAAVKAGVLAEALDDVIARGRPIFSVSKSGDVEARDADGNMIKIEDKIMTTSRWIETLPRHYWPSSDSATLKGSASGAELDEKLTAALKAGDMSLYRKLRRAS